MSNVAVFVPHSGCPCQCSFCNQHIISGQQTPLRAEDVTKILQTAMENPRHKQNQIAFFGGSFTAIERSYMLELLEATRPFIEEFDSIRISTRPDAIDGEVLSLLKRYRVKSIELGAQSMDDEVLLLNRRGHTAADVIKASRLIRECGFELGLQMMTGLYGQSEASTLETAHALAALKPDTVRIYPTVVLEGTELAELYHQGVFTPQSLEEAVEECVKLMEVFESRNIQIIRLGLHESEQVKSKRVAGAYHPAFSELCRARIYLKKMLKQLSAMPAGVYTVCVGTRYLSQARGQKKENIKKLEQAGYTVKVVPQAGLEAYEVRIEEQETNRCI